MITRSDRYSISNYAVITVSAITISFEFKLKIKDLLVPRSRFRLRYHLANKYDPAYFGRTPGRKKPQQTQINNWQTPRYLVAYQGSIVGPPRSR
jgi:hypothetical protein